MTRYKRKPEIVPVAFPLESRINVKAGIFAGQEGRIVRKRGRYGIVANQESYLVRFDEPDHPDGAVHYWIAWDELEAL